MPGPVDLAAERDKSPQCPSFPELMAPVGQASYFQDLSYSRSGLDRGEEPFQGSREVCLGKMVVFCPYKIDIFLPTHQLIVQEVNYLAFVKVY